MTRIPILICFGDNIPAQPMTDGQRRAAIRLDGACHWAGLVNARGGNVTILHLPELGIIGNTHLPFLDMNNLQIADVLSDFLHKNDLDSFPVSPQAEALATGVGI